MHVKSLKFKKEIPGGFYDTLKERVNQYFLENEKSNLASTEMKIKVALLPLLFLTVYFNILFNIESSTGVYLSYLALGILIPLIFLNILHDAAHNTLFKNKKINKSLTKIFDLIGTNSYIWCIRHLNSHHIYPNVLGKDVDIQQSDIVRINPFQEYRRIYKYQHLYMPLLYLTYSLNWILVRDFKDILSKTLGPYTDIKHPRVEVFKMILSKLFYFTYMIVIPALVLNVPFKVILLAFFIKHISLSSIAAFAVLSSHVDENANFPQPNENGEFKHTWAEHQLKVTSDYGINNPVLTSFLGGFNLHVAHHLFPKVSHAHYASITPIVKQTANEFGITYREFTPLEAFTSHFKLLKKNSNFNAFEVFAE